MKKLFTGLFLVAFIATNALSANLKAYFTYCTFNSPDKGPYIETYLSVLGNSAIYKKNKNNQFQSTIEITLVFKQGDDIKTFKKYNLLSPEVADSLAEKSNFMDQQRIPLPNGKYEFEITIKDINSKETPFQSSQILSIEYPGDKISISDIELIESLKKTTEKSIISKSGYDIIPYTSDFYPENFEKIAFYCEIYNTDKVLDANDGFLVNYFIESQETGNIVGNYRSFARETAKPVNVLLNSFTIEKLPSGNYNLVVQVKSKQNELLKQKKIFFQRSNPKATPLLLSEDYLTSFVAKMSLEELKESIACTEPISTNVEINFATNQLKNDDLELMRQYFYNFWVTRSSTNPEGEWNKYLEQVKLVNKKYSTQVKKGYQTDRGVVYLKYGPPNTLTPFPMEPLAYPYEIWHYYKIKNFSNKRFVFYSPNKDNDYPLLHSDMPGHFNNPQWKIMLHQRNHPYTVNPDDENHRNHYGDKSNDYFNNPR